MSDALTLEEKREIRKEQITLLVKTYYEKFEFLRYEPLDLLIDKSLDLFLDNDISMYEINEKLIEAIMDRKKALDERYDDDKVRDNHEIIYGRLEQLVRLLNKNGVDYQLAGALCGYLKYGEESDRCHDDIDINLNEQDIGKFQRICESIGLNFEDNRLSSPRVLKNGIPSGEHEVISRDPDSDFHIGVFPFERLEDGTVISKGYYHDEQGDSCCREEIYSPELASELFGHEEIDFRGTPVTITPPEYIYMLKNYTRNQKDMHDIEFLENKIDKDKVAKIQKLSREGKVVQNVPVNSVPNVDIHNSYIDGDNELGDMMSDYSAMEAGKKVEAGDSSKSDGAAKESAKIYVKKAETPSPTDNNSGSEDGFANSSILGVLVAIALTVGAIGATLVYLLS